MHFNRPLTFLLFFLLSFSSAVNANFTVIQRALNPYMVKSADIWGLDIMSTESQAVNVKLFGTVSKGGVPVIKLESRPVKINPGANALTSFNVASSRINYLNKNIMEIERLTLSLPPGNYEYCVYMRCATSGCDGLGSPPFDIEKIYCIKVNVEPPTPLQLAYPNDKAEVCQTRPNLNWIPPGPIVQSSKLNYFITLVEMKEKQNRVDAIKRNRPLLRKKGHSLNNLMFPLDLNALEVGKKYAWQVEAWVGDQWLSTSEVWEFEICKDSIIKEEVDTSYVLINENKDIHQFKGVLHFIYKEKNKEGAIKYELINSKGRKVQMVTDSLEANYGENKYSIDLTQYPEVNNDNYELWVYDKNGRVHILRFKYMYKRN